MKLEHCSFDPRDQTDLGMFHCPECGEMVVGGLEHPRYWEADEQDELDQVTERVRKAAEDGEVEFAPQQVILQYPDLLDEIWDALELGSAFITDMSTLNHFGLDQEEVIETLEDLFGLNLEDQYHWDFSDLLPYIADNRKK